MYLQKASLCFVEFEKKSKNLHTDIQFSVQFKKNKTQTYVDIHEILCYY